MSPSDSTLLDIPLELRRQIYTYLIPCTPPLIIRSLFIRRHFRNIYMTQQPKTHLQVFPLLLLCHQIHDEATPLLYGPHLWRCGDRIDQLRSQIGVGNFAQIRRMEIDSDLLGMIVQRPEVGLGLEFGRLEELCTRGYLVSALEGDRSARSEALKLCMLALTVLEVHPKLEVLVQEDDEGDGGADALDWASKRVRWRFVSGVVQKRDAERIVDLEVIMELLRGLQQADIARDQMTSLPVTWTTSGVYRQYPFLRGS